MSIYYSTYLNRQQGIPLNLMIQQINTSDMQKDKCFSNVTKEFILCSICHNLMLNPLTCENCDTYFCKNCIEQQLVNKCPNSKCNKLIISEPQPLLYKILNRIKLNCINSLNGCNQIIDYSQYSQHIKSCMYQAVPCWKCKLLIPLVERYTHELSCLKVFKYYSQIREPDFKKLMNSMLEQQNIREKYLGTIQKNVSHNDIKIQMWIKVYDQLCNQSVLNKESIINLKYHCQDESLVCVGVVKVDQPDVFLLCAFDLAKDIFKESFSIYQATRSNQGIYWYLLKCCSFGFSDVPEIEIVNSIDIVQGENKMSWEIQEREHLSNQQCQIGKNKIKNSIHYQKVIWILK